MLARAPASRQAGHYQLRGATIETGLRSDVSCRGAGTRSAQDVIETIEYECRDEVRECVGIVVVDLCVIVRVRTNRRSSETHGNDEDEEPDNMSSQEEAIGALPDERKRTDEEQIDAD